VKIGVVEVEVLPGKRIGASVARLSEMARHNIEASERNGPVRLIQAGANAGPVLTTLYLLAYSDGLLKA
jgi:hypothetical protein